MDRSKIVVSGTPRSVVAGHPSTITFSYTDLPEQFARQASTHRGLTTIATQNLQEDLKALLDWADMRGVHLANLHVATASLESVFLDIADRKE